MLKDLKQNQKIELNSVQKEARKTQPPNRFSENALIKRLEELGCGRPSTYSSMVSLIQERNFVKKLKGQTLAPTFFGMTVVNILKDKFPEFIDYKYTASLEEELDEVANGKTTRVKFLNDFWNGKDGFKNKLDELMGNVDFKEIAKLSTIDLHNGYQIKYNKFGAFLEDPNGTPDENGYLPSVKLDEETIAEDYLDPAKCKELLKNAKTYKENLEQGIGGPKLLGKLTDGVYKDYEVYASTGKYGNYIYAVLGEGKDAKKVNNKMPADKTVDTVTFDDVKELFAEVKLPRTLSDNFFVGIGKRGPWLGFKKTKTTKKAEFVSLPEGSDPRTITLAEAKKIWDDKKSAK